MNAVLEHTFRLLTFRHDGKGLAISSNMAFSLLIGLMMLVSLLRWEDIVNAVFAGATVGVLAVVINRPFGVGICLIFMATDLFALAAVALFGEQAAGLFTLWEALAFFCFLYKTVTKPEET